MIVILLCIFISK